MATKFIYFDLGGVVISDFSGTNKWGELKQGLGLTPVQYEEFDKFFDEYEPQVCTGLDIETLVPKLKEKFNLTLPENYSFMMDFVNRFEKNEFINAVLSKADEKYPIGLLTNIYPYMLNAIIEKGLMPSVNWEVLIDSSIVKLRKPQKEIFELATEKACVNKNEILFVENGQKHIDAAKKFGWQTFLYDSSNPQKSSEKLLKII
jgi:FMN phosphatase YigB (HAD superfamily)